MDNLKPICQSCNSSIGTMNMDEYMQKFGFYNLVLLYLEMIISEPVDKFNETDLVMKIINGID